MAAVKALVSEAIGKCSVRGDRLPALQVGLAEPLAQEHVVLVHHDHGKTRHREPCLLRDDQLTDRTDVCHQAPAPVPPLDM